MTLDFANPILSSMTFRFADPILSSMTLDFAHPVLENALRLFHAFQRCGFEILGKVNFTVLMRLETLVQK